MSYLNSKPDKFWREWNSKIISYNKPKKDMKAIKILSFTALIILLLIGLFIPEIIHWLFSSWASSRFKDFIYTFFYIVFVAIPLLRSLNKTFKDFDRN